MNEVLPHFAVQVNKSGVTYLINQLIKWVNQPPQNL